MPGYSGTPLARKLSLKDGQRVWWEGMPGSVRATIEAEGPALEVLEDALSPIDVAHLFTASRAELDAGLRRLLARLAPGGFIWISWPKKASKVPTDISEDVIRELALPLGLVDVKVCAVDDVWSGLKLMVRKRQAGQL